MKLTYTFFSRSFLHKSFPNNPAFINMVATAGIVLMTAPSPTTDSIRLMHNDTIISENTGMIRTKNDTNNIFISGYFIYISVNVDFFFTQPSNPVIITFSFNCSKHNIHESIFFHHLKVLVMVYKVTALLSLESPYHFSQQF